ncbi:TIGR01777 family oxidoreductase [Mucilaginibacter sp. BT774]|uniref:TIGR01777 family oxidoreductase n=1 Tax=Mucilaginibacter sp. BT774 TaxID=3062276 RepID=UPI0026756013|nr:TIGR01777 family oxidoreductase [Mucilaginibacter sp. BT774]MDO3626992.1 TIGR01777 family oxidoreductase [Mucilaginibacter sp. BT774]
MSGRVQNNKHILITGGTGMIGRLITEELLKQGYSVSHLSRKSGNNPEVKTYLWDVNKDHIDDHCLEGIGTIVHLAGENIADKRWTHKRKKEIIDSRSRSINLIYRLIQSKSNQVNTIISASGIGYYSDRGDELLTEDSPPKNDFMAQCCIEWEDAIDKGKELGLRILKFRTGVVLNKSEGALMQMAKPIKLGFGAPLGSGRQWVPWIHWQDVVDMYLYAIEKINLSGVYNMAAPNPVTNKQLTKALGKQLHRPIWPIKVPSFVFKLLLGEMSTIVLGSTRVSAEKIEMDGFTFKYPELVGALKQIYG